MCPNVQFLFMTLEEYFLLLLLKDISYNNCYVILSSAKLLTGISDPIGSPIPAFKLSAGNLTLSVLDEVVSLPELTL